MTGKLFWLAAGLSGFLAVALGAFGAHALRGSLSPEAQDWWRTAVLYQGLHVAPLLALGLLPQPGRLAQAAGLAFIVGTLLFSGSLYLMSVTGLRWLGAVTPLGGLAFLAGWICLAVLAL
jgi:uncharacterized membrane protein YgdD (TMEM256/DUF423 family)